MFYIRVGGGRFGKQLNEKEMENKNRELVTIEKWVCNGKSWYWVVDIYGEGIDGFSTKHQAIDAIKRWNMIRVNNTVKVKK